MGEKTFFKTAALATVSGLTLLGGNAIGALPQSTIAIGVPAQMIQPTQKQNKIFSRSDKVDHCKVAFKNRYGLTLVDDLYAPKDARGRLPVIAISDPFGTIKEQISGLYAQTLAERGFVTIAFDGSYTSESSGIPRNVLSPEINTKGFSATVDFLDSLDNVNRGETEILDVCGWGGFALNIAVPDPRIKAIAASMMYDIARVTANDYEIEMRTNADGSYDRVPAQSIDARYKMKLDMSNVRWETSGNGYADLSPPTNPDPKKDLATETPKLVKEYTNFYRTGHGCHPRSVNSNPDAPQTVMGALLLINMPILKYVAGLEMPTLVIHDEIAHSRYFSEDTCETLSSKNKELYIIPGATHTGLYDNSTNKTLLDEFEQFFKAKLR